MHTLELLSTACRDSVATNASTATVDMPFLLYPCLVLGDIEGSTVDRDMTVPTTALAYMHTLESNQLLDFVYEIN